MAQYPVIIPVSMESFTLSCKIPRMIGVRFWLAKKMLKGAALLIGCGIEVDLVDAEKIKGSK